MISLSGFGVRVASGVRKYILEEGIVKFGIKSSLNVCSCFLCYFKYFIFVFDFQHFDVFRYESIYVYLWSLLSFLNVLMC